MVIELSVTFWSKIILVISRQITRMVSDQIAFHFNYHYILYYVIGVILNPAVFSHFVTLSKVRTSGLSGLAANNRFSRSAMKITEKTTAILNSQSNAASLYEVLFIQLERIFLKYEPH